MVFLHTSLSEVENLKSRSLLERIIEMTQTYGKPVAYYISAASQEVAYLKQHYDFPIFTQVVETVRALQMSHDYCCQSQRLHTREAPLTFHVNHAEVTRLLDRAHQEGRSLLLPEALAVLEAYGIPTLPSRVAHNAQEAVAAAEALGYPVALKIVSPHISHKSDVGGVVLNLRDAQEVTYAYETMMAKIVQAQPSLVEPMNGVLVQPMVSQGQELILGGRQDPQFGAVVLAGLGGIFVEILGEVAVRVAPIRRDEAEQMLASLRGFQVLRGARGRPPADIEAAVEALLRLSQLLLDFPQIKEIDINPLYLFAQSKGCTALDCRIIL